MPGPYEVGGVRYAFFLDSTDVTQLKCLSSADGTTWAEVDAAGRPNLTNTIRAVSAFVVGTTIHVATQQENTASQAHVHHHTFDTTTDTWGTSTLVASPDATADWHGLTRFESVRMAVRSDGDLLIVYQSSGSVKGTLYARVDYAREEGAGWVTGVFQPAVENQDWTVGACVLDSADRLHVNMQEGRGVNLNGWGIRTLTAANSVGARHDFINPKTISAIATRAPWGDGCFYNDGVDERIFASGQEFSHNFVAADSPTYEPLVTTKTDGASNYNLATAFQVSNKPYTLWVREGSAGSEDVFVSHKNTDGLWTYYQFLGNGTYDRLAGATVGSNVGFFVEDGAAAIDYHERSLPLSDESWASTAPPDATDFAASWSPSSYTNVDEPVPDDSDYIQSDVAPAGGSGSSTIRLSLGPVSDPADDLNHYIEITGSAHGLEGSSARVWVELYDGATLISDFRLDVDESEVNAADPFQYLVWPLPPSEAAAITDYSALQVRFRCLSETLKDSAVSIGWVRFKVPGVASNLFRWDGSAWVAETVTYWDGAAWSTKPLKRWDGAAWQSVT